MKKVVTMGEILLRLSPPGNLRFVQGTSFDVIYGGGEANVAVALSNFGYKSSFVSKIPKHEIGQSAVNTLRRYGVDTKDIIRGGDKLAIYFLETGTSVRPSKVIYDRKDTAMALSDPSEYDFDEIFKDADWFHFSGITPALSKNCVEVTRAALKKAKELGITVSVDLNYRSKLWDMKRASEVMKGLMEYVDVCIGFVPLYTDAEPGVLSDVEYQNILRRIHEEYNFKYTITTVREVETASKNTISAMLYNGEEFYKSNDYHLHIVDRVGGGDAFTSGLISGLLDGRTDGEALEFGVAASALKHTIFGDATLTTKEEVENLAFNSKDKRIDR